MVVRTPATVPTVVDSATTLIYLLDSIASLPVDPPPLYVDLEGVKLGASFNISHIALCCSSIQPYIINVHLLRGEGFSTLSSNSAHSLKTVLESPNIPKVFFDCRNDSDALYSHFRISLDGVIDVQLLELTARRRSRDYAASLTKYVQTARQSIFLY
jgi:exonuclease 3'-5' domain-containing protein 1